MNDGSCIRLRPAYRHHVWSYDFVMNQTHDKRRFLMLTVIDEYNREYLAIKVARQLTSQSVLELLICITRNTMISQLKPTVTFAPLSSLLTVLLYPLLS